jgi:hypothetical protein
MSFAENILNKLFVKDKKNELKIDSGKLVRSESDLEDYNTWKSLHLAACIAEIKRNFKLGKMDLRDDLETVWFKNKSANGFYINLEPLKTDGFKPWFLLQYFSEQTLSLGYRRYTADYEVREIAKSIYKTERIYLKPEYIIVEEDSFEKVNQQFGNVLLELTFNKGVYLKLLATIYFDRNFTEALSFDQYLEQLLSAS